jgi:hypothetical protein
MRSLFCSSVEVTDELSRGVFENTWKFSMWASNLLMYTGSTCIFMSTSKGTVYSTVCRIQKDEVFGWF